MTWLQTKIQRVSTVGYLASRAYDAKNHMEFFCFGPLVLEESGWQGSSIYYLMSAWQMTKTTVRPGCTAGVRYPNYYYLKILYNSVWLQLKCWTKCVPQFLHRKLSNILSAHILSLQKLCCLLVKNAVSKANWFEFWLCHPPTF